MTTIGWCYFAFSLIGSAVALCGPSRSGKIFVVLLPASCVLYNMVKHHLLHEQAIQVNAYIDMLLSVAALFSCFGGMRTWKITLAASFGLSGIVHIAFSLVDWCWWYPFMLNRLFEAEVISLMCSVIPSRKRRPSYVRPRRRRKAAATA
jgi:hypothetical protein